MKQFAKITLAIMALLASAGLSFSSPAYAEEEQEESLPDTWVQISPTAVTVTLEGGDVLSGNAQKCPSELEAGCAIEVKNIGAKPFRYKAFVAPYNVIGENNELDFSENSTNQYSQLSRWITILQPGGDYQKEVISELAPGETETLYYRIDVPDDVPGGAQYAVIFVQTLSDANSSSASIQTLSQAGMVISGRSIGNVRQTAEVTEYGFQRFSFGGNLNAKATVKNTGNTDYSVYYYYTARTLFGKEIYADKDSLAAYPGNEYHINVDWSDKIPFLGIFTVEFKISAADTVKSETHIVIIMPVFIMVLLILLLTIIIVWITIIIRKRKERKARTLV